MIDDVSECDDVTSQLNDITGGKACGNDAGRSPILLQLYRLAKNIFLSFDYRCMVATLSGKSGKTKKKRQKSGENGGFRKKVMKNQEI